MILFLDMSRIIILFLCIEIIDEIIFFDILINF